MIRKTCFPLLFSPGQLGTLEIKNRLLMSPMGTRLASEDGSVTQRQIDYYAERAKGGVGAIIVECTAVDYPQGTGSLNNLAIHNNAYISGHNELVEAVRAQGAKVICQIYHVGRNAKPANNGGLQPVAPSPIPCKFFNILPRELTTGEVEAIVRKFVEAAIRVKTAGYDGVELHGGHGYLIGQFMSPASNHRQDRYGGDLIQKMTFPKEIVQGIRQELGPGFPILFRLSGDEFVEGGLTLEDAQEEAKILNEAGVDALDVSAGTYDSMTATIEPMSYPEGWKIYLAEGIRKVVQIPVIGVGAIRTPGFAENILKQRKVDFIGLGRALLADPDWPRKAREGRECEIIPCISCNNGCIGRIFYNLSIRCACNPLTGRESLAESLRPVEPQNRKKVLIVGGGPAGIQAALTAKKRGHQVTLLEKSRKLGGQMNLAKRPPGKEKISWLIDYFLNQLVKNWIPVNLSTEATPKIIIQKKPDVVILATGAKPLLPNLPGIKQEWVYNAWDVLEGKREVKGKNVLIIGGGLVGCEVALSLSPQNQKVSVVEMLGEIAQEVEPINRMDLISKIKQAEVEVHLKKKIERIEENGVVLSDKEGREKLVHAEAVILALGAVPVNDLAEKLAGRVKDIIMIGDCQKPRKIIDAIYEGFQAALHV